MVSAMQAMRRPRTPQQIRDLLDEVYEWQKLLSKPLLMLMNITTPTVTIRNGVLEHEWPEKVREEMRLYQERMDNVYHKLGLTDCEVIQWRD